MNFETVFYQLKRLQTPDEEFAIDWNKNGQCNIRLGNKQFRLNFKTKRMYRSDEKVEFGENDNHHGDQRPEAIPSQIWTRCHEDNHNQTTERNPRG